MAIIGKRIFFDLSQDVRQVDEQHSPFGRNLLEIFGEHCSGLVFELRVIQLGCQ